jgi:hypothetical protein
VEAMEDRLARPVKMKKKQAFDPKIIRSLSKHIGLLSQGIATLEDKVYIVYELSCAGWALDTHALSCFLFYISACYYIIQSLLLDYFHA